MAQDFFWEVNTGGYEVETLSYLEVGDSASHKRMMGPAPVVFPKAHGDMRHVSLKDYPALFEDFAALEPEAKAVRAFVNRFGLLGKPVVVKVPVGKGRYRQPRGETLETWEREVASLRIALKLWQLLDSGADDELKQCLRWPGQDRNYEFQQGVILVNPPGFKGGEFFDPVYESKVPPLEPDDARTPVRHWLQTRVSSRIEAHVALQLMEDDRGNLTYTYQPKNLLGGVWLQLSQIIAGVTRLNHCLMCGTPIVIKRGGRSDRVLCSDRCTKRAERAGRQIRKKRAPDA